MAKQLHGDALACLEAAIQAVEPRRLVSDFLGRRGDLLAAAGSVHVLGIGKASGAMAEGALEHLGDRLAEGVLIVPAGQEDEAPKQLRIFGGGHPVPNPAGVEGAGALAAIARQATDRDLLLCLISGGGSALMTLPPAGVSLEDVQATTDLLLRAGATILELNAVRKHLDRLKGGRLARLATPARIIALVLSDVVGDPLDVIASGPVSPDPTTFADARQVIDGKNLWSRLPDAVRNHLEKGLSGQEPDSPSAGDPCFDSATVHVIGSNTIAADAAVAEAARRGYNSRLISTELVGEAREVGVGLAARAHEIRQGDGLLQAPACLVAAGETTVTVRGQGRGGRNQELVLGAARALDGLANCLVASAGTDGIDGPTDAAGAIADGTTIARARSAGLDADAALAENDSYQFFAALDDLIVTGPTGTNVMDVQVVLVGRDPSSSAAAR